MIWLLSFEIETSQISKGFERKVYSSNLFSNRDEEI